MSWKIGMRAQGVLLLFTAGCLGDSSAPPVSAPGNIAIPTDLPTDPGTPVTQSPVGEAKQCDLAQLDPPRVYGHKVKTLLTGLPLTTEELTALEADPDALSGLVDGWIETEEARAILLDFFRTAFQQNELDVDGLTTMLRVNNLNWGRFEDPRVGLAELINLNIRESFARTALRIVESGRPFTDVLTTDQFEMTTALLALHALLEHRYVTDGDRVVLRTAFDREFVFHRTQASTPPISEALNENSPNFLHFYLPGFEDLCLPDDQETFAAGSEAFGDQLLFIFSAIMGRPRTVNNRAANQDRPGNPCRAGNALAPPLLSRSDFSDWRTVQFLPLGQFDNRPSPFWDVARLRTANRLLANTERVGFFTTLGFFTTWPTNLDNASRVTLNQTLITALGASFDGNTVDDFSPPNLDRQHATPGTACYGCHQTLDPMRDFFRVSYSYAYGLQDNESRINRMEPIFVFRGVNTPGSGVKDLSRILAEHPDFPAAWVQKMCFHATTKPCPETSKEFEGILSRYIESGLNFKDMVKDLYASTLVTNADCVEGGQGALRSISRREQLCVQLSNRLGLDNICGDEMPLGMRSTIQRNVSNAIVSVPKDTFARGEPDPIIISDTSLFTRATREVTCTQIAERAYAQAFGDMARDAVIEALVTRVMGLPAADPRHEGALGLLSDHVERGVEGGAEEPVALQSALVVACMSPGVAGLGF